MLDSYAVGSKINFSNLKELNMNIVTKLFLSMVLTCSLVFLGANAFAFDDKLLIGDIEILSGQAAAGGLGNYRGLQLAVKHKNERGGVKVGGKAYELWTKVYDHKYTSEGGVTTATKLVFDDGAKFVVGTFGSAPSISASEGVFEPNKILYATTGWSQKCIGADKPYTFRLHMTGLQYNGAFYSYAKENLPKLKKVALLAINDATGYAVVKDVKAIAKEKGFEITTIEFYDRGTTTDFYPFLTKIMATEPDIFDTGSATPGDEGLILKQLYELGWNGVTIAAGQVPGVLLEVAGKEATNGVYLAQTLNYESGPPIITPEQEKFAEDYRKTFNEEEVPMLSEKVYDMAMGLFQVMEKEDSLDTTIVRDALEKYNWKLLNGSMSRWGGKKTYGIDHQLITPVFVSQIRDGKVVTIGKVLPEVP